jgi:DNA ligase (NAD+)
MVSGSREVHAFHRRLAQRRESLRYEIDGVVAKADDLAVRRKMGETSHHPRWALAYKFEPRVEVTRVMDIAVQVGRSGVLTPVALLWPVDVGGVTVSRATLHNREQIRRLDVRKGDLVRIHRAGDVIPEVVERLPEPGRRRLRAFRMPSRCPSCGARLTDRGPYTICPNRFACRAQLVGRIAHFASQDALDIEGLGEETAQLLAERGLVRSLGDLFRLEPADLVGLPGFGERSAHKLVRAIQARRRAELGRFLFALAIPEVGVTVARDLAEHFGSLARLLGAGEAELRAVRGIGPKMAPAIHAFLRDPRNRTAVEELQRLGVRPLEAPVRGGPLAGKRFVFTGGLAGFTRPEAKRLVESAGARTADSVTRDTDYVVVGSDPGEKLERARELGVVTLDERGFRRLLARHGIPS